MKQDDQAKKQSPEETRSPACALRSWHTWLYWILGSAITLLTLMVAALFVVSLIIDSASVKQKIQTAMTEQTGGHIDYQEINLCYFPRLAFELHQIALTIPDQVQATVTRLHVSPEVLPLLTGKLHLALLELETPLLDLKLPAAKPKATAVQPFSFAALKTTLATAVEPIIQVIPGLELRVSNGQVALTQNKQKLFNIDGLNLHLGMSVTDPHSAKASLQTTVSELNIFQKDRKEPVKDITLSGKAEMMDGRMTVTLDQLSLAEPNLDLTGNLTLASTKPAIILNLSSDNIDVDATRKTALALAGDTTPIKEIFDYLRGGQVPRISFTSRGESPSELGDLNNILIKGRLEEGKVSIPAIELDLTEVIGNVTISEGILQGSQLSTRLEDSTGQDGSLQVALGDDKDLFQLELMLSADLAKAKTTLERVVDAPAFITELKKVSRLQGTGYGRLTLGDSLDDINAKVEISELKLTANYQGLPLPITITQGQFNFSKKQVDLGKLSGTLGRSKFADLSCQFLWEKDLFLDVSSGRFDLDMAELYPWLASLEGLRDQLKKVSKVTGGLNLSALQLKGEVDKPYEWKFASIGTVTALSIDTELLTNTIKLTRGRFTVNTQQLTFEKLQATSQDAALTLTGKLRGFPKKFDRLELTLDGRMGPKSVEWLSDFLELPKPYAIHAPLTINKAQISWQPDSTASIKGAVSIDKGPKITAVVDYRPNQLQVHQLNIKDQHSDANMTLDLRKDFRDLKFKGTLRHETLQSLFVDSHFSTVQLEGDFAVTVPQKEQSKVTAKGQLNGENLVVLLSSGEEVAIEQVTLKGDGSQVEVDISKLAYIGLTWEPVKATVSFNQDRIDIKFADAKMCGIHSPGVISITGNEFALDMTLEGKGLDVATSYTCLREGQVKMTGSLDFSSQITAKGQLGELINSLQGPLEMTFSNGVIEQDKVLSRTLEVLNVTEIVKGRLPNLSSTGLAYKAIKMEAEFHNGKLIIPSFFMDGETLDLIGHGEIGLEGDNTIDGQLLAAPFKTIDSVINMIPGMNYLLGGGLVTIPVSITGNLADPRVSVMSPSAVGSSLLNLAGRIFKSPFKLIESIIPWSDKDKN